MQASSSFEKLKDNFLILPDIEILPRQDLVVARLSNSRKNELLTVVTRLGGSYRRPEGDRRELEDRTQRSGRKRYSF